MGARDEALTPFEIIRKNNRNRDRAVAFVENADKLDIYTARAYLAAAQVFATLTVADALHDALSGASVADVLARAR